MANTEFETQVLEELLKISTRIQVLENKIGNLDNKIMITDMHVMSLGDKNRHEELQEWKKMKDSYDGK